MTWAYTPAYGSSVMLGPTQQAVYRFVLGVTEHGRRPTFSLGVIAERTGKPVSSVHNALGRLRALGLIGFDARTGRTGGHRLWRVVRRARGTLDAIRHRLAVARITRRWYASEGVSVTTTESPAPQAGTLWGGAPDTTPDPRHPDRASSSFRDAMRQAGFTPWWRDRGGLPDDPRPLDPDTTDSRSGGARPGGDPDLLATEHG